jgi:two-component sensor histidine kinase
MLALAGSLVSASARSEKTVRGLSSAVSARLAALGQAHGLVLNSAADDINREKATTTLHALIETILAPYREEANITVSGADVPVGRQVISSLALLLHEFATNAAKYGALSTAGGRISISVVEQDANIVLTWNEQGGPLVEPSRKEGFGSLLVKTTLSGQLGGRASHNWQRDGLTITISIPKERLQSL